MAFPSCYKKFKKSFRKVIKLKCYCTLKYMCFFFPLTASFYGNSYIHIPLDDASERTDIQLQFRTHRPDGLLLLAAGTFLIDTVEPRLSGFLLSSSPDLSNQNRVSLHIMHCLVWAIIQDFTQSRKQLILVLYKMYQS